MNNSSFEIWLMTSNASLSKKQKPSLTQTASLQLEIRSLCQVQCFFHQGKAKAFAGNDGHVLRVAANLGRVQTVDARAARKHGFSETGWHKTHDTAYVPQGAFFCLFCFLTIETVEVIAALQLDILVNFDEAEPSHLNFETSRTGLVKSCPGGEGVARPEHCVKDPARVIPLRVHKWSLRHLETPIFAAKCWGPLILFILRRCLARMMNKLDSTWAFIATFPAKTHWSVSRCWLDSWAYRFFQLAENLVLPTETDGRFHASFLFGTCAALTLTLQKDHCVSHGKFALKSLSPEKFQLFLVSCTNMWLPTTFPTRVFIDFRVRGAV